MYDDGIDEVEFPTSVCPDREAGKAHGPHRIDGTWREHCPGVTTPEAQREAGDAPAHVRTNCPALPVGCVRCTAPDAVGKALIGERKLGDVSTAEWRAAAGLPEKVVDRESMERENEDAHIVPIDSKARLVAVARLANSYGHAEAATVVRQLAEAVGVQCRGGRIYLPRRRNSVARGWARFIQSISFGGHYEMELVVGPMVDRAVATGTSVTIPPELAARIRAYREMGS